MRHGAPVRVARDGAVLRLTLARPEKLNALDGASLVALRTALARAATDPAIRVVLLTGTGRAFCVGADLAEVAGPGRDVFLDTLAAAFGALRTVEKPLVGAVNGLAVAGGLELLLCCDLVVAAEGIRLGDGHVLHGLVPGGGAATSLPSRVGHARARQLLLTGESISADTAREWGLVNWVVETDALDAFAGDLAHRIAALDPTTVAALKAMLVRDDPAAFAREAALMRLHLATDAADATLRRFGAR